MTVTIACDICHAAIRGNELSPLSIRGIASGRPKVDMGRSYTADAHICTRCARAIAGCMARYKDVLPDPGNPQEK